MTLAATLTAAEAIATPLLAAIKALAPLAGSGGVSTVISALEQIIPLAINEGAAILQPIQNIIADIQGSGAVTADQIAALAAMNASLDAAFNAAASADGV